MAELSVESGVPIATIKYYLREGLLPPGERTSPNQAQYGDHHIRRLKLIRALVDVGGLSIADVHDVVTALDDRTGTHSVLGLAQHGLPAPKGAGSAAARAWAWSALEPVAAERGWQLKPESVVVESLVSALAAFHELGRTDLVDRLDGYAELAERVAELDLSNVADLPTQESIVESSVIGMVLGDALMVALRRLAQQYASARRFSR